jgi:ribonuclease P protein component
LKRFSFPKTKRLVSNRQFKTVMARGLRASNGVITLFMAENDCGFARLGVSVSRHCGGAVLRNRLKRLARETFRQCRNRIPQQFDYLLMISGKQPKRSGGAADNKRILKDLTLEQMDASFRKLAARVAAVSVKGRENAGSAGTKLTEE